jgi:hypothetical protein
MSTYSVFYLDGLSRLIRPSKTLITLNGSGIKIHKEIISWPNVMSLVIDYKVGDQQGSIGGAIAGDLIAGQAGAIVGGMRSVKKVEPYIFITYEYENEPRELRFICSRAEALQKEYLKRKGEWEEFKKANAVPTQPKQQGLTSKVTRLYFLPYTKTYKFAKDKLRKKK